MCRPKYGALVATDKVKVQTELHSSWTATVQDAVTKLVRSKVTSQKASLYCSLAKKQVEIRSPDGKECWYNSAANNVAYFAKFGEGKALVFVTLDPLDGHLYCRVLMGKAETLSNSINRVRKKSKEDGDHFPNFRAIQAESGEGVVYDYLASNVSPTRVLLPFVSSSAHFAL